MSYLRTCFLLRPVYLLFFLLFIARLSALFNFSPLFFFIHHLTTYRLYMQMFILFFLDSVSCETTYHNLTSPEGYRLRRTVLIGLHQPQNSFISTSRFFVFSRKSVINNIKPSVCFMTYFWKTHSSVVTDSVIESTVLFIVI